VWGGIDNQQSLRHGPSFTAIPSVQRLFSNENCTGDSAGGTRNGFEAEAAVQGADGPVLLRFTGAGTCGCGDVAGVLAAASVPSAEPEMLRRVTIVVGHLGRVLIRLRRSSEVTELLVRHQRGPVSAEN
jgi:hypothetical protein